MDQKNQPPILTKNKIRLEKATEFVLKYKTPMAIGLGAVLLIVLISVLVQTGAASNQLAAGKEYDNILNNINYAQYMTNRADSEKLYQEQISRMDALITSYPNTVGSTRARLLLAKALYEDASRSGKQESLSMALSHYKSVIDAPVADFFKALATIGIGQCNEQKNDFNAAFANYSQILLKYGKEGFNPLALVGMARSKEMMNDVDGAIAYYRRAAQEYPESLWARYAKGKIYSFNEGLTNQAAPATGSNALPYIIQ